MEVVGRKQVTRILDQLMLSKQPEFLAVYGRRRVGKTYLIRQYFADVLVFDFSGAYQAETSTQQYNFHKELIRVFPTAAGRPVPKSWEEAFQNLADYLYSIEDQNQKMVVFLDEIPWLDKARSGFLSSLEYFWNQHGSKMQKLILVGCGSAASWMIQNMLEAKGGLYRRITKSIELLPFSLCETEMYFEYLGLSYTKYQIIQLYMALGGIPFYLKMIPRGSSVTQAIDALFFAPNAPLANEFEPLYHSLFANGKEAIEIGEALSGKIYGLTQAEILKQVSVAAGGSFSRILKSMIDCAFIEMITPYGKKKKDSIYRLTDFFTHFYIKFVKDSPKGRANTWESYASSSAFMAWTGYAFENICLLHMPQIHHKLGIQGVYTEISSWRFSGNDEIPGAQVDLIIDRKDGIIHLCEAKFSNNEFVISKDYNTKLRQKRASFQHVTKTKKQVVTTLMTTYPAMRNKYYLEEIHTEVTIDDLFVDFIN
ncbi:MAG: AAA family ATPase [Saprospiraceae bacterium]|nr:AAA family ATPase [Saprospiraceae bacterium]